METLNININTELANEYCEQYRKAFQTDEIESLNNQELIEAFLEDRLKKN